MSHRTATHNYRKVIIITKMNRHGCRQYASFSSTKLFLSIVSTARMLILCTSTQLQNIRTRMSIYRIPAHLLHAALTRSKWVFSCEYSHKQINAYLRATSTYFGVLTRVSRNEPPSTNHQPQEGAEKRITACEGSPINATTTTVYCRDFFCKKVKNKSSDRRPSSRLRNLKTKSQPFRLYTKYGIIA